MSKDTVQADGQRLAEFSIIRLQEELAGSRRVQGETLAKLNATADTSVRWKALARRYRAQLAAAQAEAAAASAILKTLAANHCTFVEGVGVYCFPSDRCEHRVARDALAALRKRGTSDAR